MQCLFFSGPILISPEIYLSLSAPLIELFLTILPYLYYIFVLLCIAADKTIRIWNTTSNVSSSTSSTSFTSSSSFTNNNGTTTNNDAVHTLEGHTQGVSDIAWSPDGQYLASASDDGTVRLWNVETVRKIIILQIICSLGTKTPNSFLICPLLFISNYTS